jgi:hypothetical protein
MHLRACVRVTARAGVRDGISLVVSLSLSLLTAGADFLFFSLNLLPDQIG